MAPDGREGNIVVVPRRINPDDGCPYSFEGLRRRYQDELVQLAKKGYYSARRPYGDEEVSTWWNDHCEECALLAESVGPFAASWPEHWGNGGPRIPAVAVPRVAMPAMEQVEEHCGPQGEFWGQGVMRTIPAERLREAVESVRRRPPQVLGEVPRCRMRVLNIPEERGAKRRGYMEETCLGPLCRAYPGLDAGFADGVVAKDLLWEPVPGSSGGPPLKQTKFRDHIYVADESMWHPPTQEEQPVMIQNALRDGFTPQLLHAFMKGEDEQSSWGYTGCQIAHVEAWNDAFHAGVEWLMICEDDVLPNPIFGMEWPDVWGVVAQEVSRLRDKGEDWDLLYVGKGSATSREGGFVTDLVGESGYNLKMHCYCLSRRGLDRMLAAELSYLSIRPQDELLAALSIRGRHPRPCIAERIERCFPGYEEFRSLSFSFWGIVFQLQHFEHIRSTEICQSAIAEQGRAASASG